MHINKLSTTAIAAICGGSLVFGVAAPTIAAADAPSRHHVAGQEAPQVSAEQMAAMGHLGETISLVAKIGTAAQAQNPDPAKLKELQSRLKAATDKLLSSVQSSSLQSSSADGAAARPADAVSDVQAEVKKLLDDVAALLAAVVAKDLASVTADVAKVVADLQALLLSVPALLTSSLPLPLPLPIPLDR